MHLVIAPKIQKSYNYAMFYQILKRVWFLWALCLIFNIITLLLVLHKASSPEKIIALHYNVVEGVDWYGPAKFLYQIPLGALIISVLNFILFSKIKSSNTFYTPLAAGVSILVQIALLFATILIIRAS